MPRPWWGMGLVGIAGIVAAILRLWTLSIVDRFQQRPLLDAVSSGHLRGALGGLGSQTSGPGFALVAPVFALVRHVATESQAFDAASLACLVLLAPATVAALRASGIPARSPRELLAVLVVVAGVPVLACYLEAFHPADVLATAAVLAGYAAAVRGRLAWAAVFLGFGLATRQWVIVAIAILAVLAAERDRLVLVAGSLAVFGLLVMPFFIADPHNTLIALAAGDTARQRSTLAGLLPLPDSGFFLLSRYLPLVLVGAEGWWLHLRRARLEPAIAIAALVVALAVRAPLDPAGWAYYAAPGFACLVVLGAKSWRGPVMAAAGGFLLYLRIARYVRPNVIMRVSKGGISYPHVATITSLPWSAVATVLYAVPVVVGMIRLASLTGPGARTGDRG